MNNTPTEVLEEIQAEVKRIFGEITDSTDWKDIEWLESQVEAFRTTEKERKDFEYRKKKFNQSNVTEYDGRTIVEPNHESGVYGLLIALTTIKPDVFPVWVL